MDYLPRAPVQLDLIALRKSWDTDNSSRAMNQIQIGIIVINIIRIETSGLDLVSLGRTAKSFDELVNLFNTKKISWQQTIHAKVIQLDIITISKLINK